MTLPRETGAGLASARQGDLPDIHRSLCVFHVEDNVFEEVLEKRIVDRSASDA